MNTQYLIPIIGAVVPLPGFFNGLAAIYSPLSRSRWSPRRKQLFGIWVAVLLADLLCCALALTAFTTNQGWLARLGLISLALCPLFLTAVPCDIQWLEATRFRRRLRQTTCVGASAALVYIAFRYF